jgi:hypothetical protein
MRDSSIFIALFVLCSAAPGCADPGQWGESGQSAGSDGESVAEAADALLIENALAPNALAPNALAPNALAPNALAPNALAPNALTVLQAATPAGAAARMLMKYTVGCALPSSATFHFSWTDLAGQLHDESYPGLLGLAPEWATGPLTSDAHQRLVSGCLAARVNYYGVSVLISLRSDDAPLDSPSSQELSDYPHVEGAFWGNLFAATPYLNACYDALDVNISRQDMRDCAVGHLSNGKVVSCGMIKLRGSCSTWCQSLTCSGHYYPSCVDRPGVEGSPMTKAVITTALP